MILLKENNTYKVKNHKFLDLKLEKDTIESLKANMKLKKSYFLLKDNENKMECLIGVIKLLEIKEHYLLVKVYFFNNSSERLLNELSKINLGLSLNSIFIKNELCGFGLTPCPTEVWD